MRKLTVAAFVSLDGVMQAPGGPDEDTSSGFAFGGWVFPFWDEATDKAISDRFDEPFDLLLGRRTYDIFASYWPNQKDDAIGKRFNAVTKYVATRSDDRFGWENTVVLRGDAVAQVAELKTGDGPPLLTQGSSVLIQHLWRAGLIDEFRVMTFPVLLGTGKRLFEDGGGSGGLKLEDHTVSPKGVVIARYTPTGPVPTGDFTKE